MILTAVFFVLTGITYAETKIVHVDIHLGGCTDSDGETMVGLDGEEMGHADWKAEKFVMTMPEFADPLQYDEGVYALSVSDMQVCKQNLATIIKAYKNPAVTQVPPTTSIYPRDDVKVGSENTLICLVTGFYPPRLNVTWTKNGKITTQGMSASQLRVNVNDFTFNQFHTLTFTPAERDIYTCRVEHSTLDLPITREFDVEVSEPSLGPSVFCGVGLTLGLLGVATGTFFLVKGNQCN